MKTQVCGTCTFFDSIHEICQFLSSSRLVVERRRAESPACWQGYLRKAAPGELTRLFEKNRLPEEWTIPRDIGVSLVPF